jgi:hypothetical protein
MCFHPTWDLNFGCDDESCELESNHWKQLPNEEQTKH